MQDTSFVPQALRAFFDEHRRVALAFSGGTDSAYLLYAAKACGCEVVPIFVKTVFQPDFELTDAETLCRQTGVALTVVHADVLGDEAIRRNGSDRCYHCKRKLFTLLLGEARRQLCPIVIDGTNASDDASDRPGMRALRELGVLSPLKLCGVTKAALREYSREAGLFTWDKPAYACLATRIACDTPIKADVLRRVERCEGALHALGYRDLRVRVFCGAALLQLPRAQMARAVEEKDAIESALHGDFERVFLDLKER